MNATTTVILGGTSRYITVLSSQLSTSLQQQLRHYPDLSMQLKSLVVDVPVNNTQLAVSGILSMACYDGNQICLLASLYTL